MPVPQLVINSARQGLNILNTVRTHTYILATSLKCTKERISRREECAAFLQIETRNPFTVLKPIKGYPGAYRECRLNKSLCELKVTLFRSRLVRAFIKENKEIWSSTYGVLRKYISLYLPLCKFHVTSKLQIQQGVKLNRQGSTRMDIIIIIKRSTIKQFVCPDISTVQCTAHMLPLHQ